jgi:hypothetical protein
MGEKGWGFAASSSPLGDRYSRFCELCRQWRKRIDVTMRQVHHACGSGDHLLATNLSSATRRPAMSPNLTLVGLGRRLARARCLLCLRTWLNVLCRSFP